MTVSHYLLILAALTGAASNLVFKKHVYVNTLMTWSDARDYCRENYVDLSISDTLEEFDTFTNQTAVYAGVRSWIGLSKNPSETNYTQWCDGTVLSFTKWDKTCPTNIIHKHCVTTMNNLWSDYICKIEKPFFCYSEVIVVEEKKTWDEALKHCRTYYTDLFSVTTQTDLLLVNNISQILTASFWTGLHFLDGSWFWVNQKSLGSLVSLPSCPNQPLFCGAHKAGADIWENRDCREKMYFICYR